MGSIYVWDTWAAMVTGFAPTAHRPGSMGTKRIPDPARNYPQGVHDNGTATGTVVPAIDHEPLRRLRLRVKRSVPVANGGRPGILRKQRCAGSGA